jgi:putative ABC transport system substrate-binding protein
MSANDPKRTSDIDAAPPSSARGSTDTIRLSDKGGSVKRREFIAGLAGAVALPVAARGQQSSMPVVGFLSSISEAATIKHQVQFRRGLRETGFVPGQNVVVEYRWAEGQYDRLPGMAADLVRRKVDLIAAQGPPAAIAARTATTTIPIVFAVGIDPVAAGLVESFNRPGGNATGSTLISGPLGQKRLEILRERYRRPRSSP